MHSIEYALSKHKTVNYSIIGVAQWLGRHMCYQSWVNFHDQIWEKHHMHFIEYILDTNSQCIPERLNITRSLTLYSRQPTIKLKSAWPSTTITHHYGPNGAYCLEKTSPTLSIVT